MCKLSRVRTARSPSSKYVMRLVKGANAIASEPMYISLAPCPMASGEPLRAAIIRSSSPWNKNAKANAPSSRDIVFSAASAGLRPLSMWCCVSIATVSVSVSVTKLIPYPASSTRNSRKFSMMPLCTTATGPAWWGCALSVVGAPCVAQRVWPIPDLPASGSCTRRSERLTNLPTARRRSSTPLLTVAIPALS